MGETIVKHYLVEVYTREAPVLYFVAHQVNRVLGLCVAFLNTPIYTEAFHS